MTGLVKTTSGHDEPNPVSEKGSWHGGLNLGSVSSTSPKFVFLISVVYIPVLWNIQAETMVPSLGLIWNAGIPLIFLAPTSDSMSFVVLPLWNVLIESLVIMYSMHSDLYLPCQQPIDHSHMLNEHIGIFLFMTSHHLFSSFTAFTRMTMTYNLYAHPLLRNIPYTWLSPALVLTVSS